MSSDMMLLVDSVFPNVPAWERADIARNAAKVTETVRQGDALLWMSSGNAVPADLVSQWVSLGLISQVEADATDVLRAEQTACFLDEYVARQKSHGLSAEEQFEMRAAFGEGVTVVDVVSGRRHLT